jgi:mono/diheme cytochrome c family protein
LSAPAAFLLGGIAALAATGAGALLYTQSGIYDVAASKPHTNIVETIAHETMIHSVRMHARNIDAPARITAAQVVGGFCAYEAHCVMCHGAAAVARQRWVNGMTPDPPYLLDAPRRWTRPQLFWIVKHGIKMTGMPAWETELTDAQIWNVVAFIEANNDVSPHIYLQWRAQGVCAKRQW